MHEGVHELFMRITRGKKHHYTVPSAPYTIQKCSLKSFEQKFKSARACCFSSAFCKHFFGFRVMFKCKYRGSEKTHPSFVLFHPLSLLLSPQIFLFVRLRMGGKATSLWLAATTPNLPR